MNELNRLTGIYRQQMEDRDYEQAVLTANHLSNLYPDDANLYNLLAAALKLSGQLDAALKCYEMSLLLDDNQANVHMVVGEILSLQGKRDRAFGYFLKGMELKPQTPEVLRKVGGFLIDAGYLQDAETLLLRAVNLGMRPALEDLLDLYDKQGDKDRLLEHMQKHQGYFSSLTDSLSFVQALLSTGQINKAVAYLKRIEIEQKPREWRRAYHNLLAQAYERLGFYQQAYNHYRDQNMNTPSHYDRSASEAFMREVIDVSDRIVAAGRSAKPVDSDYGFQPLFIVGLPRTGTSLLEQIVGTQDAIVAGGELSFIASAYQAYMSRQKSLQDIAEWYLNKLAFIVDNSNKASEKVRWVVDKMPSNFVYVGFIRALFPKARFLYCRRDAIDTGFSIYKQNFNNSHRYASDLGDIAHFIAQERDTMAQWIQRFGSQILTLDYENIATDFDNETRRVFDFLDLEWNESVREFHKNSTISNTASYSQVRSPIHTRAVGYYRNFEPFLGHLIKGLERYGILENTKDVVKVA